MCLKCFLKKAATVMVLVMVFSGGTYALLELFYRAVDIELTAREAGTIEARNLAAKVGASRAE